MFGRATIRLGIGPHSSYNYCCYDLRQLSDGIAMNVALLYTVYSSAHFPVPICIFSCKDDEKSS